MGATSAAGLSKALLFLFKSEQYIECFVCARTMALGTNLSRGEEGRRTSWRTDQLAYRGGGQRRRTSWRASLLIPQTKKEDFLEDQFAYPGDEEGGLPGGLGDGATLAAVKQKPT